MGQESLSDKAVSMCANISEVETLLASVNDYGDATGFCQEFDQIVNDAHAQMGAIRVRVFFLRNRYMRTQETKEAPHHVED